MCDASSNRINGGCVQIMFPDEYQNYAINVYAQAQNACGLSDFSSPYLVNIQERCSGPYTVYPNPASNTLYISYQPSANNTGKKSNITPDYQVALYDLDSHLLKIAKNNGNTSIQLNLTGLQTGQYILQISDTKSKYSKHIQINK